MFPVPREFTNAEEVRANRRTVRARLQSLPAWQSAPPPTPVPTPTPEPAPLALAVEAAPPEPPAFVWKPAPAIRIRAMVACHYGLTLAEITSAARSIPYLLPRNIAMYLCIRYAGTSFPQTGRLFGNRDHTTVLHAVKRTKLLMQFNSSLADDVAEFVRQIEGWSIETGGT